MQLSRAVGLLVLCFLFAFSGSIPFAAQADDCSFRYKITFVDGSSACISSYPDLAAQRIPGTGGTLQELMPAHGALAVAATVPTPACPLYVGLGSVVGSFTPLMLADPNIVRSRTSQAIASCERASGSRSGCDCKIILSDARSPLTREEFDARYGQGSSLSAANSALQDSRVAAQAGLAAQAQQDAPVQPGVKPLSIAPPVQTRQDDVAKLQLEVEELRKRLQSSSRPSVGAAPVPAAVPKSRVRALVIGNSAYVSFGRLTNPRHDAEAIARKLTGMGIDVDLVLDADRDSFVRALNQYSSKALGQDVNILYYAGHGVQVEGVNYLLPTNMSADGVTPGYVKLNGLSLNAVLDYLPARTRLVFLDACRDNPVSRNLVASRGSAGAGLAPVTAASGTLIAYATKDGATAADGAGINSPYTTALLEHLDKPQDIAIVLRQVRQTVMRMTSNRQEPWEYGSLIGDQLILSQIAR